MKLFDTFLLGSGPTDLDLLETRLYEHDGCGLVYKYVIVEGDVTMTGLPKPMYFAQNRERFDRWKDLIRYVPIHPTTMVPGKEPGEAWAREHCSRQATIYGLQDAVPGDLVLHGDCDEILSVAALSQLTTNPPFLTSKMNLRHFSYTVEWEQPWRWPAPSVARYGNIGDFTKLREHGWPAYYMPDGEPAGWHLSWLGGPDAIEVKAYSFTHVEAFDLIMDNIDRFYRQGQFIGGGPDGVVRDWYQMEAVDIDPSWPRWIHEGKCPELWLRPRAGS